MADRSLSPEFNEQVKRDIREGLSRARPNTGGAARWHKKGGKGGGGPIIKILPLRDSPCPGIGFSCDCSQSTVIMVSCETSEVAVGDVVNVWNQETWFHLPPELLSNTVFWAHWMEFQPVTGPAFGNPGPCAWVVFQAACAEPAVPVVP